MPGIVDVLHVVPAFAPARGGIETLVEGLCRAQSELHGLTAAVCVTTPTTEPHAESLQRDVRVFTVPMDDLQRTALASTGSDRAAQQALEAKAVTNIRRQVGSIIRKSSPRIVHMHAASTLTPFVIDACDVMRIPVLFHMHGTVHHSHHSSFRRRLRNAPWVCAVSNAVAESIHEECQRESAVAVIPNGVVDPMPATRAFRPASPSVALVGRLSEEKGFDVGLRSLAQVRQQVPDLLIRIVGDGPEASRLHRLAHSLDLMRSIEFFGSLPHEGALRVIAGADVVLVPSTAQEGFSLTAVEAALLERPVVATIVGGLPETVKHGTTGLVVQAGDVPSMTEALVALMVNRGMRQRLGSNGRSRALNEYSHVRFVDEIGALYERIIGVGSREGE